MSNMDTQWNQTSQTSFSPSFPDGILPTFWYILRLNFTAYRQISHIQKWTYRKVRLHFSTNPTDSIYMNATRLVSCWISYNLQSYLNKPERHMSLHTLYFSSYFPLCTLLTHSLPKTYFSGSCRVTLSFLFFIFLK